MKSGGYVVIIVAGWTPTVRINNINSLSSAGAPIVNKSINIAKVQPARLVSSVHKTMRGMDFGFEDRNT